MKYYWEASHYKSSLGDIVLNRLSGTSTFKNFGTVLNLQTINAYLEQQKRNRKKFVNIHSYKKELSP
jgi:hypothetical protein